MSAMARGRDSGDGCGCFLILLMVALAGIWFVAAILAEPMPPGWSAQRRINLARATMANATMSAQASVVGTQAAIAATAAARR